MQCLLRWSIFLFSLLDLDDWTIFLGIVGKVDRIFLDFHKKADRKFVSTTLNYVLTLIIKELLDDLSHLVDFLLTPLRRILDFFIGQAHGFIFDEHQGLILEYFSDIFKMLIFLNILKKYHFFDKYFCSVAVGGQNPGEDLQFSEGEGFDNIWIGLMIWGLIFEG